ncbi:MAG: hypothetical protein ABFC63_01430 [Thermoguttaceae bacterium]
MGRLTLTNDREMHLRVLTREKRAGFTDCDAVELDGVFLAVHRKRRRPVANFLKLPNGDAVACTGTLVYKGLFAQKALQRLYDDFDGDVETARSAAMGAYLVAIKKGPSITVFGDKYEGLFTFYHHGASHWILGNSLAGVAEAVCRKNGDLSVNEFTLLEDTFLNATLGNETFFRDILTLRGTEHVSIDCRTKTMRLTDRPYQRAITDPADLQIDRMAARFADHLRPKAEALRSIFGDDVAVMATGGMDNRLIMAAILAAGIKPTLVHGVGSQSLDDIAIAHAYADKFGLKIREIEWTTKQVESEDCHEDRFLKHGFMMGRGLGRGFFEGFETGPFGASMLTLTGMYGEIIRNLGSIDVSLDWQKRFAPAQFSLDLYMDYFLSGINHGVRPAMRISYDELYRRLLGKMEGHFDRYNIHPRDGAFPRDSFPVVLDHWIVATLSAWGIIINEETASLPMLNDRDLHEMALEIPAAWRKNDRFSLRIMQELFPPILDVPFHSHCRAMVLHRKTMELRQPRAAQFLDRTAFLLQQSRAGRLAFEGLRRTRVGHLIRRLSKDVQREQRKRFADPKTAKAKTVADEMPVFRALVDEEQERQGLRLFDPQAYQGDLYSLARYWKLLYGIRKVREAAAAQ